MKHSSVSYQAVLIFTVKELQKFFACNSGPCTRRPPGLGPTCHCLKETTENARLPITVTRSVLGRVNRSMLVLAGPVKQLKSIALYASVCNVHDSRSLNVDLSDIATGQWPGRQTNGGKRWTIDPLSEFCSPMTNNGVMCGLKLLTPLGRSARS